MRYQFLPMLLLVAVPALAGAAQEQSVSAPPARSWLAQIQAGSKTMPARFAKVPDSGSHAGGVSSVGSAQADEDTGFFDVHWDGGLRVRGPWEGLRIKIAGDVQNDTAGYANVESAESVIGFPIESGVQWRRARLYAEGSVQRHIEFKLRYDFAVSNPPNLKDAYVSLVDLPIPTLEVTGGRFKAPLGLDGYTPADDTVFLERSTLSTAFLPSRNTGFLVHGDSPRLRIRWSIGALYPDTDDLRLQDKDNLGYSGRFAGAFHPGGQQETLLHLGINAWRRNIDETIQIATRPESHIAPDFVDTGAIAANHLNIGVGEFGVQRGPLTVQSELALADLSTEEYGSVSFDAFYVQASYTLTGEVRPYLAERGTFTRPKPTREFLDGTGGLGAFEVGARFSRIDLDDGPVTGGRLDDWSFAFNWYPLDYAQVMSNVIFANLADADVVTTFQMRLQVAF